MTPASVGASPRLVRVKSARPTRSSRALSCLLTALCVRLRAWAAAETVPCWASATTTRSPVVVGRCGRVMALLLFHFGLMFRKSIQLSSFRADASIDCDRRITHDRTRETVGCALPFAAVRGPDESVAVPGELLPPGARGPDVVRGPCPRADARRHPHRGGGGGDHRRPQGDRGGLARRAHRPLAGR